MNCRRVSNLLSAYVDHELTGVEMHTVREHLRGCGDCARELESLRQTKVLLGSLSLRVPPPELEALLLSRANTAHHPVLRWLPLALQGGTSGTRSRHSANSTNGGVYRLAMTGALVVTCVWLFAPSLKTPEVRFVTVNGVNGEHSVYETDANGTVLVDMGNREPSPIALPIASTTRFQFAQPGTNRASISVSISTVQPQGSRMMNYTMDNMDNGGANGGMDTCPGCVQVGVSSVAVPLIVTRRNSSWGEGGLNRFWQQSRQWVQQIRLSPNYSPSQPQFVAGVR